MSASILKELFEKFMNDNMTPDEVRRFHTMATDPANRKELDHLLEQAYRVDHSLQTDGDMDLLFDALMLKAAQRAPATAALSRGKLIRLYRRRRAAALAAAILLLVVATGAFFYMQRISQTMTNGAQISARIGERKDLVLPDGTKVWLNAGSVLTLPDQFNTASREVTLSGEAYFDVAKNEDKPFIIHVPSMDIKVLGTAFNVRAYPDEDRDITSLISGKILVSVKEKGATAAKDYYLSPLQKVIVQKDRAEQPAAVKSSPGEPAQGVLQIDSLRFDHLVDQIPETAWMENKLFFNAEPLSDVIRKIERWYGVTVRLDNPAIRDLHFTGSYQDQRLPAVMEALHTANPEVHYKIENNEKLIILY